MIVILTPAYNCRAIFDNYDVVVQYITGMEKMDILDDDPRINQVDWSFVHHNADRVQSLYRAMEAGLNKDKLKEAYDRRLAALEICSGNYQNPVFVTVTDDLDVEGLKRSWCFDYYKTKDFFLIETFDVGEFEQNVIRGLGESLPYLEWPRDKNGSNKAYPYGIYIRVPYPLVTPSIAHVVNQWRHSLMIREIV